MNKKVNLIIIALCICFCCICGCGEKTVGEKTVIDMAGDEVVIPERLESVYSTSNPCTDMMIALGVADNLTGAYKTMFDNAWFEVFFPNASKLEVLQSYNPEAESLIAAGVDLIFVPREDWARTLRSKGVCAVCIRFYTLDDVKRATELLGEIFGEVAAKRGDKWIKDLESKIAETEKKYLDVSENEKPVAYEIQGEKYKGLFRTNYGNEQEWLKFGGGIVAMKDFGEYKQSNPTEEAVLATNPDIIFIGGPYAYVLENDLYNDPKWEFVKAVINRNVHIIPVGCCYWNSWSVEYPLMIDYVFSCMYPDRVDFSLVEETHNFYSEYYGIDFTDEEINYMLNGLAPNGEKMK